MDSSITSDFEVAPLDAVEIWKHAKTQRRRLWADATDRVDLLSLRAATDIWTIDGMRAFRLRFAADGAMSGETGLTAIEDDTIVVTMPAGIRHRLGLGLGSARFALARELGYATLHWTHLSARVPSDTLANGARGSGVDTLARRKSSHPVQSNQSRANFDGIRVRPCTVARSQAVRSAVFGPSQEAQPISRSANPRA
jgi:hypothetical protein